MFTFFIDLIVTVHVVYSLTASKTARTTEDCIEVSYITLLKNNKCHLLKNTLEFLESSQFFDCGKAMFVLLFLQIFIFQPNKYLLMYPGEI